MGRSEPGGVAPMRFLGLAAAIVVADQVTKRMAVDAYHDVSCQKN